MRRLREAIGLSRHDMAARIKMGNHEYADLEDGRRPFTCADALRVWRRVPGLYQTGVCLADLFEGDDNAAERRTERDDRAIPAD